MTSTGGETLSQSVSGACSPQFYTMEKVCSTQIDVVAEGLSVRY